MPAEAAAAPGGATPELALAQRQAAVLARVAACEAALAGAAPPALPTAAAAPSTSGVHDAGVETEVTAVDPTGGETQQRLQRELLERGITRHRFVRAPPEYYDRPLEFRQGVLGAASVAHLCKTIVMENTRAHPDVKGWEDANNSKYYLVIVQYAARLNTEKLKTQIYRLSEGRVPKKYYNMRLAPEEVSDELSGFTHNAVSPIGIKTRLPIVLSHRIAELQPDFFWLGAGEVDLKVGLGAADFIREYSPVVLDCTYDGE